MVRSTCSWRALLLVRTGADARLTDELPADEVDWLKARAPAWTVGTLMQLVQTLSEALARTRDAQQFQIQTEVALLSASLSPEGIPTEPQQPREPRSVAAEPEAPPQPAPPPPPAPERAVATVPADAASLRAKWPDVVDHVKARNGILGSLLTSANPIQVEDGDALVIEYVTDFNRKRAESSSNRKLIEEAIQHAFGRRYRIRSTTAAATAGAPSLLDDPVINYAARTFGGQPRRIAPEDAPASA